MMTFNKCKWIFSSSFSYETLQFHVHFIWITSNYHTHKVLSKKIFFNWREESDRHILENISLFLVWETDLVLLILLILQLDYWFQKKSCAHQVTSLLMMMILNKSIVRLLMKIIWFYFECLCKPLVEE